MFKEQSVVYDVWNESTLLIGILWVHEFRVVYIVQAIERIVCPQNACDQKIYEVVGVYYLRAQFLPNFTEFSTLFVVAWQFRLHITFDNEPIVQW